MTGNSPTPRPWRITGPTEKKTRELVGANGELVARLTALDLPNAELIVAAVNAYQVPVIPYVIALTAIERLRGNAATTIEDHERDRYSLNDMTMPQDVAFMWAKEIHRIDAKAFLDEAIQDAAG